MSEFIDSIKRKGLECFIYFLLFLLAKTKSEDWFYRLFDKILVILYFSFGKKHEQTKGAIISIRKAFRARIPLTQIARLLLQRRLSEKARKRLARNFFVDWITESKKRERLKEGFKAPWFFVVSPTNACNLHCYGCYAYEYPRGQGMSYQTLSRIVGEAKSLGIRFLTISGGEPFYYKDKETGKTFLDLAEEHNDIYFQVYTNGTYLTDERIVKRLAKAGNIAPAISQEGMEKETDERRGKGTWEKICRARRLLYEAGVLQGFSITVTRQNAEVVSSDDFIDDLIEREVSFGWYFIYIPIGKKPAVELMPTPEQRNRLRQKIWEWRSTRPIFIGDFWNDGPWVGGCIACGRKYFHINSKGDIEPCVFIHFAVDNIYNLWKEGKGLREAITSPFFMGCREEQLTLDNPLKPCLIIDNPECLRRKVKKYNAYPTHPGAETILFGKIAHFLDNYSREMERITRPELEKMIAGDYNTEVVQLSKVIKNHWQRNKREFEIEFGQR